MTAQLIHYADHNPPVQIERIDIDLLDAEEIERRAVCTVVDPKLYDKNIPRPHGANDHRMGSVDSRIPCGTCGHLGKNCPGHEGYVPLPYPVYNPAFKDDVFKLLKMVCYFCSSSLIDWNDPKVKTIMQTEHGYRRFTELAAIVSKPKTKKGAAVASRCPCCGAMRPWYENKALSIRISWKDIDPENEYEAQIQKQPFTALHARNILSNISDELYAKLGFVPEDYEQRYTQHGHVNKRARPEHMILTHFMVSPPCIRPSLTESSGSKSRGQDDLTHKLQDIIKTCVAINTWMKERGITDLTHYDVTELPLDLIDKLQYHCATYIDNNLKSVKKSTQRSGAPIKGIAQRLAGKEGRVRNENTGKRVNQCGRAVITPDPSIPLDAVGIPKAMAIELTYPARVTDLNKERLAQCVKRGFKTLYGAKGIIDLEGNYITLEHMTRHERNAIVLHVGMIVVRYIQNGDPVLFNRQPTLHRGSMMVHFAVILPGNTIRLNELVTPPYNADFDGDEMNLHVLQDEMARAEGHLLMAMPLQMRSAQNNKPQIGLVQDSLHAAFMFTDRDTFITREDAMQLLMQVVYPTDPVQEFYTLPTPAILKPKPLWTGKQILSKLIHPSICLQRSVRDLKAVKAQNPTYDEWIDVEERHVVIRNGQLVSGSLCKSTIGRDSGSIIDLMILDLPNASVLASRFLHNAQRMLRWFVDHMHAFTIGVGDCLTSPETQEKIRVALEKAMLTMKRVKEAKMVGIPDQDVEEYVFKLGNSVLDYTGRVIQETINSKNNGFVAMAQSGSKGSAINLSQIMCCVGQNANEGARIGVNEERTLPLFIHGDKSAESKAFVKNGYWKGLEPYEFFFHTMGGREGLVDTAVKTGETGYVQRRLEMSMQTNKVEYDGTVRNAQGDVIEFVYGSDRYDASKQEAVRLPWLEWDDCQVREQMNMTLEQIEQACSTHDFHACIQKNQTTGGSQLLSRTKHDDQNRQKNHQKPSHSLLQDNEKKACHTLSSPPCHNKNSASSSVFAHWQCLQSYIDQVIRLKRTIQTHQCNMLNPELDTCVHIGINCHRLVDQFIPIRWNGSQKMAASDLCPIGIIRTLNHLFQCMRKAVGPFGNCLFTEMHIRSVLHPRYLIMDRQCTKEQFLRLVAHIRTKFEKCLVHPGEAVGPLAGESLGEPATQMTLNTFHFAGVHSKNVTLGIPRLVELINATALPKKSQLVLFLKPPFNGSEQGARLVARNLECLTLRRITKSPTVEDTTQFNFTDEEQLLVNMARIQHGIRDLNTAMMQSFSSSQMMEKKTLSRYVLRFVLDKSELMTLGLSIPFVLSAVRQYLGPFGCAFATDANMPTYILHVYMYHMDEIMSRLIQQQNCATFSSSEKPPKKRQRLTREDTCSTPLIQCTIMPNHCCSSSCNNGAQDQCRTCSDTPQDTTNSQYLHQQHLQQQSTLLTQHEATLLERTLMVNIQNHLLTHVTLAGTSMVDRCDIVKYTSTQFDTQTYKPVNKTEYVIHATYCNGKRTSSSGALNKRRNQSLLQYVMSLDAVDRRRTFTNDIVETCNVLDVEAASQVTHQEIKNVMKPYGIYVNDRHISMVVNTMTYKGYFTAMTRHGMKAAETGYLQRSSFEETVNVFQKAALVNATDPINGTTENVMVGKRAKVGTGCIDVLSPAIDPRRQDDTTSLKSCTYSNDTPMCQSSSASVNDKVVHTLILEPNKEQIRKEIESRFHTFIPVEEPVNNMNHDQMLDLVLNQDMISIPAHPTMPLNTISTSVTPVQDSATIPFSIREHVQLAVHNTNNAKEKPTHMLLQQKHFMMPPLLPHSGNMSEKSCSFPPFIPFPPPGFIPPPPPPPHHPSASFLSRLHPSFYSLPPPPSFYAKPNNQHPPKS